MYNVVWDLSDNPLLYLLVGVGVGVYDDWPNITCLLVTGGTYLLVRGRA